MFRVLVANSKGGCGKTTLATNLAGWFAFSGRRTTMVDCDPQGSSLAWCALRAAHLPRIHALGSNDPAHGLSAGWMLRVPPATQVLLIDTPAGLRAHEFERFARHADALVIPVVPSPIDLRATLVFLDMVRKLAEVRSGRLRIALVASRLRERTRAARSLEATLERLTQAARSRVRDSQAYVALAESGRSLFDDEGSAARPHREDWKPLLEWLERLASLQGEGNVTPIARAVPQAV